MPLDLHGTDKPNAHTPNEGRGTGVIALRVAYNFTILII